MTKERLRRYRDLLHEKQQLEQQLETIEGALYNPKIQHLKQTPRAQSQGNATEDLANKHLELMDRYREKLAELTMEQLAIEEAIERLPFRERKVLRAYYIRGLTWEEAAVAVGYTWRHVHRVHSSALQLLAAMEGENDDKKEVR